MCIRDRCDTAAAAVEESRAEGERFKELWKTLYDAHEGLKTAMAQEVERHAEHIVQVRAALEEQLLLRETELQRVQGTRDMLKGSCSKLQTEVQEATLQNVALQALLTQAEGRSCRLELQLSQSIKQRTEMSVSLCPCQSKYQSTDQLSDALLFTSAQARVLEQTNQQEAELLQTSLRDLKLDTSASWSSKPKRQGYNYHATTFDEDPRGTRV
eukprot:TRINITY_DN21869_c0_g1_i1.p1 TRINITY_DN21869_c0_g1~~TRINITY_DN21869_c0_g1_i1.p1  ORF type:complete len:213 (+),score=55.39 TRINITY_DN21869_c0_g1_i1:111-749(+)